MICKIIIITIIAISAFITGTLCVWFKDLINEVILWIIKKIVKKD